MTQRKKKINDTVLWVPVCQPANADVFPVVASILSIRKVTFRERSDDRKYVYSRGFLCAKPRLFCKLLCCFLFFFLSFFGEALSSGRVAKRFVGCFSNYDGDGRNQDVKKAIGLLRKTTTLQVYHAFLYICLPSLHDYDVKMPN